MGSAAIVVLGDVGRSPRMGFHALSLAEDGTGYDRVYLIGYYDSELNERLQNNKRIRKVALRSPPPALDRLPFAIGMALKFVWAAVLLFVALLLQTSDLKLVLCQNPPAIPTMLICWIVARLKGARWVVDWHNYMWTVFRTKWALDAYDPAGRTTVDRSLRHRIIDLTYAWEGWFGRRTDGGLCVTRAMRDDLRSRWNVHAAVLYDRPPAWTFGRVAVPERHELFHRLAREHDAFANGADNDGEERSRFSVRDVNGAVSLRPDRPFLLISSTSWTEDEDFGILLDALVEYDRAVESNSHNEDRRLPKLVAAITGRGPLKEFYKAKIDRLNMLHVQVLTPWLQPADYPRLVGSADVGVSLHTSTSGLDLPMKVVDMLGCGVPILAKRFGCLDELLTAQVGEQFDTAAELAAQLAQLATGHPDQNRRLHTFRQHLVESPLVSWEKNWLASAYAILAPGSPSEGDSGDEAALEARQRTLARSSNASS